MARYKRADPDEEVKQRVIEKRDELQRLMGKSSYKAWLLTTSYLNMSWVEIERLLDAKTAEMPPLPED